MAARRIYTLMGAMLAGAAGLAPALAQDGGTESATVEALLACRAIAEAQARTACMDARLADFAAALDEGRLVVVERERIRAVERESFGISLPSMAALSTVFGGGEAEETVPETETLDDGTTVVYRAGGGVEELRDAPVASVDYNPFGKVVVTLENGQVWQQSDSTRVRRVRPRHMDGLTADITRGLFGSMTMELSHSGPAFKVERLR